MDSGFSRLKELPGHNRTLEDMSTASLAMGLKECLQVLRRDAPLAAELVGSKVSTLDPPAHRPFVELQQLFDVANGQPARGFRWLWFFDLHCPSASFAARLAESASRAAWRASRRTREVRAGRTASVAGWTAGSSMDRVLRSDALWYEVSAIQVTCSVCRGARREAT